MLHLGQPIHPDSGKTSRHDFFGYGEAIRAAIVRRLPAGPARALDVGTGFGRNAAFLARALPPGSHVWSVDPSAESLGRAAAAIREAGLSSQVSLLAGAAETLPFLDGGFDLATGVMLFHHLVDVPPTLRQLGRVTRPGGRLVLVDWGPTAHLLPFAVEHRPEDFFTPRQVARMLQEVGLRAEVEHHPMWYLIAAAKP